MLLLLPELTASIDISYRYVTNQPFVPYGSFSFLLGIYYFFNMVITSTSIILGTLVINIARSNKSKPRVPHWLKVVSVHTVMSHSTRNKLACAIFSSLLNLLWIKDCIYPVACSCVQCTDVHSISLFRLLSKTKRCVRNLQGERFLMRKLACSSHCAFTTQCRYFVSLWCTKDTFCLHK